MDFVCAATAIQALHVMWHCVQVIASIGVSALLLVCVLAPLALEAATAARPCSTASTAANRLATYWSTTRCWQVIGRWLNPQPGRASISRSLEPVRDHRSPSGAVMIVAPCLLELVPSDARMD